MSENSFVILLILAHGSDKLSETIDNNHHILKMANAGDAGNLSYVDEKYYRRMENYIRQTLTSPEYSLKENGMGTLLYTFEIFRTYFRKSDTIMKRFSRMDMTTSFKATHPQFEHNYYFTFDTPEVSHFSSMDSFGINFIFGVNQDGYIQIPTYTNVTSTFNYRLGFPGQIRGDKKKLSEIVADARRIFNVRNVGIIDLSCRSLPRGVPRPLSENILATVPNLPGHPHIRPVEVRPVEVRPDEVIPVEVRPDEVIPVEVRPVEVRPDTLYRYPTKHVLKYPPSTIKELPPMNEDCTSSFCPKKSKGGYRNKLSKCNLKKRNNRNSKKRLIKLNIK